VKTIVRYLDRAAFHFVTNVQSFNRAQLFILAAGLGDKRQPLSGVALDGRSEFLSTVWEWSCTPTYGWRSLHVRSP
jgi:hypothetical protein